MMTQDIKKALAKDFWITFSCDCNDPPKYHMSELGFYAAVFSLLDRIEREDMWEMRRSQKDVKPVEAGQ